jgi:hypothetical protein
MTVPSKTSIKLHGGIFFDFEQPERSPFTIETVAHHLSKVDRYAGMLDVIFSVGQHCLLVDVIVAHLVSALHETDPLEYWQLRFEALMHDNSEFVMGDMVHPLKIIMPEYRAKEAQIEDLCSRRFGFRRPHNPVIMQADKIARYVETYNFDPHFDGVNTTVHQGEVIPDLFREYHLSPMNFPEVKDEFLARYNLITGKITSSMLEA